VERKTGLSLQSFAIGGSFSNAAMTSTPGMHEQIASAASLLKAGGTVAFPTETVYGLGADISNSAAVRRIFEIKKRPEDHPLIVHFGDASQLYRWARVIPDSALALAERFWPGPLTLILPRTRQVPGYVTGGQETVGLRVPDHPVALALLAELGVDRALAAPSANRFGHVSPTTAVHVRQELGGAVDMILDGGPCRIGLESTIVGFEGPIPIVLRPGGVPIASLAEVLGDDVVLPDGVHAPRVRVPGSLASHYAPATPLELLPGEALWQRAAELCNRQLRIAVVNWSTPGREKHSKATDDKNMLNVAMPADALQYGSLLYATLRDLDDDGFDRLLIEAPPDDPAWLAIADRLRRAAHTP
jgi:L-threonylcarbamoyladenylate synthase